MPRKSGNCKILLHSDSFKTKRDFLRKGPKLPSSKKITLVSIVLGEKINLPKMNFDSFSPLEVIEAVANTGVHKGNMRLDKVFFSAVSAGCLLSFACGTVLSTNSSPWFQENAPGLIRTISSLVFPYGLVMIILTGADLCTGSFMVSLLTSTLRGRITYCLISLLLLLPCNADYPGGRCLSTGL